MSETILGWSIPPGVKVERLIESPECIVIDGCGGWVTADMEQRIYGLGACKPRKHPAIPGARFSGKGWQKRLLDAAYLSLLEAMRDE